MMSTTLQPKCNGTCPAQTRASAAGPLAAGEPTPCEMRCAGDALDIVRLCAISDIPKSRIKAVDIGQVTLAVYNVDGEFFVTDNRCTHGEASLADGMLEDDVIECALHGGAFNVRTGEVVYRPCTKPLRTYKVIVEAGDIFVDLQQTAQD